MVPASVELYAVRSSLEMWTGVQPHRDWSVRLRSSLLRPRALESHWKVFRSGLCDHSSCCAKWIGRKHEWKQRAAPEMSLKDSEGGVWWADVRKNKWRELDMGLWERSPGNWEAELQRFARVFRELVAEPRLRPDQDLFTTLCLRHADTQVEIQANEKQTFWSREAQIWHPQPAYDSVTYKRPNSLGREYDGRMRTLEHTWTSTWKWNQQVAEKGASRRAINRPLALLLHGPGALPNLSEP